MTEIKRSAWLKAQRALRDMHRIYSQSPKGARITKEIIAAGWIVKAQLEDKP